MDECLNDDDDEEHHRVFFDYFDAQHERLSVHAGSVILKTGNAFHREPACRTARPQPTRFLRKHAPVRAYGRSTER